MTTTRRRPFVSLAVALTLTLALGACARSTARPAFEGLPSSATRPLEIRFDNQGRERVHVYLVGAQRQWLLGGVEPGAIGLLRIPEESLDGSSSFVRLAVLSGEGVTLQAARSARAILTVAQPATEILSQRWRFSQGQLTSLKR